MGGGDLIRCGGEGKRHTGVEREREVVLIRQGLTLVTVWRQWDEDRFCVVSSYRNARPLRLQCRRFRKISILYLEGERRSINFSFPNLKIVRKHRLN